MSQFETPNGKTIVTFIDPSNAHVRIKFTTGGELPAELSGIFTSIRVAEQMIRSYISRIDPVEDKVKKSVKGS